MKNLILILLMTAAFGCTCDDDPEYACPTEATIDNFAWMAELKEMADEHCEICEHSIVSGTYKGQTVIYVLMTDQLCDGIFVGPLYNCQGEIVEYITDSTSDQEKYHSNTFNSVLYRCQ